MTEHDDDLDLDADGEPVIPADPSPTLPARYRPGDVPLQFVPRTLNDLAPREDAEAIMSRRGRVMDTARRIMIAATFPADYVLFRAPDGTVTAYLQTKGAHRLVDVLGLETYGLDKPERIPTSDPTVFYYIVRGSARSRLTGRVVEGVEGGRSSADFNKEKSGIDLEMQVRKSAWSNFEGRCARILAGLEGIPVEFLDEVWKDTTRRSSQCPRGRGFGRIGAAPTDAPVDVPPPECPHCHSKGVYRPAKGDRNAFYGCPQYAKHPDKKFIVDAAKWIADHPAKLTPAQSAGFTGAPTSPPPVGEVFGNNKQHTREPGEDDE